MKKIELTRGQFALVSDEDFEYFNGFNWSAKLISEGVYVAVRMSPRPNRTSIYMHREIMGNPLGFEVDHIDGNPLNNQRHNLRICSHFQNMYNRKRQKDNKTGYKGVRITKSGKYQALISSKRQTYILGSFVDPVEAAKAYDEKAKILHGVFARLNFPQNL